jgi:hypothetical protein
LNNRLSEKIPVDCFITSINNTTSFGRITNLTTIDNTIMFEAVKTRVITIFPLSFNTYLSGEKFYVSKDYRGFIGVRYILVFCKLLL